MNKCNITTKNVKLHDWRYISLLFGGKKLYQCDECGRIETFFNIRKGE